MSAVTFRLTVHWVKIDIPTLKSHFPIDQSNSL